MTSMWNLGSLLRISWPSKWWVEPRWGRSSGEWTEDLI